MRSATRGVAVIINNKFFPGNAEYEEDDREGSEKDRDNLENLLKDLQFKTKVHNDLSRDVSIFLMQ